MKKVLGVLGLMALLSGCSLFDDAYNHQHMIQNRDNDYLQSQTAQELQVPSDASNTQLSNDYPVPSYNYIVPKKPVSIVPPGSAAAH